MSDEKKPAAAVKKAAADKQMRNLQRALREERTGLVAVARACLAAGAPGEAVLARLEAMVRGADPKTPARTKDALEHGYRIFARALEQQQAKPQQLFEPDVGHVAPSETAKLLEPAAPPQLGLAFEAPADPIGDVAEREQARRRFDAEADRIALAALQNADGPLSDAELMNRTFPSLAPAHAVAARKRLTQTGRVVKAQSPGYTRWTPLERTAA